MTTSEVDQLRRRMASIRREMDAEVEGVVENAKTLADWRYYLNRYPWLFVGAAAVVGYAIVPRKVVVTRLDAETLAKLAKRQELVIQAEQLAKPTSAAVGGAVDFMLGLATRAALAWLGRQAVEWMHTANQRTAPVTPPPNPQRTNEPAGATGGPLR